MMKHNRVTAGLVAIRWSPLAGIVASLAGALPAWGGEVPFTEHVISTAADGAQSVFAADLDGDGDIDVLSASFDDDKIAWYENDGGSPPTFTERVISTAADEPRSVFATDVDGDGDTDVLSASWRDDKIAWYENDGGSPPTFIERVISTTADSAYSVFATDVDGDGNIDVLSASRSDDKIAWYESDGGSPPTFTEWVITEDPDGPGGVQGFADDPWAVFATDVDGDGDTDVLSASFGGAEIAWYESDGGAPPTFTEHVVSTIGFQIVSVFATDLDGDGDTDVLSGAYPSFEIVWYESDAGSPPNFSRRSLSDTGGARSIFATDVDGDGDMDVLAPSHTDDKIVWYENDGGSPPTFTEHVISTIADGASSAFAIDVDGDGDMDILSASSNDDKIAWYENTTLCSGCLTDVDGSGDTAASDLAVLLGAWGPCAPGDVCECLDSDNNGIIGAADLAVLLGSWGPCEP